MGRAAFLALFITICFASGASAAGSPLLPQTVPVTRKAVDERVAALVEQIWKQQNAEGHWDQLRGRPIPAPGNPNDPLLHGSRGGTTALALLALHAAGQKEEDPRFKKALKWLVEQPWTGTYFRGLRAALYGQLKDPSFHKLLKGPECRFLLNSLLGDGMFTYDPPTVDRTKSRGGDFSNTQYGILGMWAAADAGAEIPAKDWDLVERAYLESICPDGGWAYRRGVSDAHNPRAPVRAEARAYGSMTVAALATLFVIWEKHYIIPDGDCRGRVNPDLIKAIEGGLDWMTKNYSASENPGRKEWNFFYYCYGMERVGVASGVKYFGKHDWYREVVSNYLNGKVRPHDLHDESWMLLFLSYGRAPVAFNKLNYGLGWNAHPRDLAGLCKQLSRNYERHHNWQIMPITANQDELHDAPILAMSGSSGFTLKPDDVKKIRTYLLRGGTLFAEAIGGSSTFTASVRKLCQQMFASLEMVPLSQDHLLYSAHFRLAKGQPRLFALNDGVRLMVILSPGDIGCQWQRGAVATAAANFEFGDNLIAYASDRGELWSKEESYWPVDLGKKPAQNVTIGRIVYGGLKAENVWNPSGGSGWQRLDILSRNAGGPGIATTNVDLSEAVEPKAVPIMHLTGTVSINLSDEAKKNLKAYIAAGGLLLVDAAGGKQLFADSFTSQAEELLGGKLVQLPADALPFLDKIGESGKLWYRHRENLPRVLRSLDAMGLSVGQPAQWNVIYLPCDLTYALNGAPALEPIGLDTRTAEQFAAALISWRTGVNVPASVAAAGD